MKKKNLLRSRGGLSELFFLGALLTDFAFHLRFVGPYLSGIRISDWIVRISYLSVEHPLALCGGSAELAHEFDRFVFSLFGGLVLKRLPKVISLLRGATYWSRTCQEKCELDTVVTKGIIPSNDKLFNIKASEMIWTLTEVILKSNSNFFRGI